MSDDIPLLEDGGIDYSLIFMLVHVCDNPATMAETFCKAVEAYATIKERNRILALIGNKAGNWEQQGRPDAQAICLDIIADAQIQGES